MFLETKNKFAGAEVKTDPFSLEALVAWLRTKDGDTAYCYMDNGECLLGQYFTAKGFRDPNVGSDSFNYGQRPGREEINLPCGWNQIALAYPRTFAAALARAEALL